MALDDTQVFLPELWASHARFRSEKIAVVCGSERLTWADLNFRCNRVANALLSSTGGKPAKIAVIMNNSIAAVIVMLGIAKSGACIVPVSTMLKPKQVATMLNDSGACAVFASNATLELAEAALAEIENRCNLLLICADRDSGEWQSLSQWMGGASDQEPSVRYDLEDDFNIIYSSGTTGAPKGIVQTHRARQHWSYSNALELRMDHETVALATTSLYSNGTWFMLLPPLFVGGTVVIMETFSPDEFLNLLAVERITHSFMVPTQCIGVLESPALESANLSEFRYLLCAGSPLRQDTKELILDRLCAGLFELYGFTEGFATICRPEEHHKRGSVGTPVIGFDLRIIDGDENEAPVNEPGEIVGYGGGLMKQYHGKGAETEASIWRDERGRTFLRSGDIGRLDEDGFLYILDRKKDMIISGGFNVFPRDIEEIVGAHPYVSDVTVIGVPDSKWGERPLALVIPVSGLQLDVVEICAWANDQLAKPQRLKCVEIRGEFPRNSLGKVIKRELREPYWNNS